jgi:hypothetical protein
MHDGAVGLPEFLLEDNGAPVAFPRTVDLTLVDLEGDALPFLLLQATGDVRQGAFGLLVFLTLLLQRIT